MSVRLRLAFGPLTYVVEGPDGLAVPAWCEAHRTDREGPARRVEVSLAEALPAPEGDGSFGDVGFVATHGAEGHRVVVERSRGARWGAALAALLGHDAPGEGAVVIHGAAVRVEGGVALLLAPCGTGKTTFARAAGSRSFAHNAVIARCDEAGALWVWSLPFAGDPHPELDAQGVAALRVVAQLRRGERPGFEWIARSEATIDLVRATVRAPARDPWARERFMIASALATRARVGRLRTTRGPGDLEALDAALHTASHTENDR